MAVRVLLVEDNDVYRSSLELLLGLQPELEVVGAVGSGDEAADAATRLRACLLYTSPSPRDPKTSRMPSSA